MSKITGSPERSRLCIVLALVLLGSRTSSNGQSAPRLVRDTGASPGDSNPDHLVAFHGALFFSASDGVHGNELFRSDGTAAGTFLLKDVRPGADGSWPQELVVAGDTLFFTADDGMNGRELWRSDGTEAGTQLVKDITPSTLLIPRAPPLLLTAVGRRLFFAADDGIHARSLWTSDGTPAGTRMVQGAAAGSALWDPRELVDIGGTLFLVATDSSRGGGLFRTDGGQTVLVKEFGQAPRSVTAVGGGLFFTLAGGDELWHSDGTESGTISLNVASPLDVIANLTAVGGLLFFSIGSDIWKSDGTAAGTTLVKELPPPARPTPALESFVAVGGTLYFFYAGAVPGLWKSDGTDSGTTFVFGALPLSITPHAVAGSLYFTLGVERCAAGACSPDQLWRSDGTANGTVLVKQLGVLEISDPSPAPVAVGRTVLFPARDASFGTELWRTDGTAEGSALVKDINPLPDVSTGSNPVPMAGTDRGVLVFATRDEAEGPALWGSDGTFAGTSRIASLLVSPFSEAKNVPGIGVFFAAELPPPPECPSGGCHRGGVELWKSDDTESGTVFLKDIAPGDTSSNPTELTVSRGVVFFAAGDGTPADQLWKSDGREEGTVLVQDFGVGPYHPPVADLTDADGILFFTVNQQELWKSTAQGTARLARFRSIGGDPGGPSPSGRQVVALGRSVLFAADDGVHGVELWRSDGTASGTQMVKDIDPGGPHGNPRAFARVGALVFFAAHDGVYGNELWRTDGTESGTVLVKDITPGQSDSLLHGLTAIGDTLMLLAGTELWRSDGTTAGTRRLESFQATELQMTVAGAAVFFAADDGVHGVELWTSDGTEDGTVLVGDIRPGLAGSEPRFLRVVDGADGKRTLFFSADDGIHGRELWALALPCAPAPRVRLVAGTNPTCAGDTVTLDAGAGYARYEWSNGTSGRTIDVTPSETAAYRVTVTDPSGCFAVSEPYVVSVTPPLRRVTISFAADARGDDLSATAVDIGGGMVAHQWGFRTESGGAVQPLSGRTGNDCLLSRSDFPAAGDYLIVETSAPSCGSTLVSNELHVRVDGTGVSQLQNGELIVPIVLDVDTGSARYTTELALTNRGETQVGGRLHYEAALGTRRGSGSVPFALKGGEQLFLPQVIASLRTAGLPIPPSSGSDPQQGGALRLTFSGTGPEPPAVSTVARTVSPTAFPEPPGWAGVAYAGLPSPTASAPLIVHGLRISRDGERSNLAVYSTSSESVAVIVTLHYQIYLEDEDRLDDRVEATYLSLDGYGWTQLNGLLESVLPFRPAPAFYATVERVSPQGSFGAYGVVNDRTTNDGSFLPAVPRSRLTAYMTLPVLVETGEYTSELVLTNAGARPATVTLDYVESLSPGAGAGGKLSVSVPGAGQLLLIDALDRLRKYGAAIGAKGAASYAGALRISVDGESVLAGARIVTRKGRGSFGIFVPAVLAGDEAQREASICGLRADETTRSNVAFVNAGADGAGEITLNVVVHDGDADGAARWSRALVLAPGAWRQIDDVLTQAGVRDGWLSVVRMSGTAPWVAYGVLDDGRHPRDRTGDGAYVSMDVPHPR